MRWAQQTEASKDWGNLAVNKNPIFLTNARVAGHSYPAYELLESYAVTLYDLDVSRERQLRAATSSTEQANRSRNAGRLRVLEEKERDLREKAEALISKCQTPDEREMLRMRYLMLMDWATIARVLYGDKPGFYDGKMYRQRALMLHKDTMVWLEKGLLTEEKHEDENT